MAMASYVPGLAFLSLRNRTTLHPIFSFFFSSARRIVITCYLLALSVLRFTVSTFRNQR